MAAKRVPLVRLPVLHQAIARRYPAAVQGEGGDQVEDQHKQVDAPEPGDQSRQPRCIGLTGGERCLAELVGAGEQQPAPAQSSTIRAVTIGPPIAILNSVEGESESPSRNATPPNIHRLIPEIPIP